MAGDIEGAFSNIPNHAESSAWFGGRIPDMGHLGLKAPVISHGVSRKRKEDLLAEVKQMVSREEAISMMAGTATLGFTSAPGFFAVFGKAIRYLHRNAGSIIEGNYILFRLFQWVDDLILFEVDIGNRLLEASAHLQWCVHSILGPNAWNDVKYESWTTRLETLGLLWDTVALTVSIPSDKVERIREAVKAALARSRFGARHINSLVGSLRQVVTFIPSSLPRMNALQDLQSTICHSKRCGRR